MCALVSICGDGFTGARLYQCAEMVSQLRACFDVRRWFSQLRACFDVRRWFHRCALVSMCGDGFTGARLFRCAEMVFTVARLF